MRIMAGLLVIVGLVAGCGTQPSAPADGTEAWASDDCLYAYRSGIGWGKTGWCKVLVSSTVWSLRWNGVALGTADVSDPEVTVYKEPGKPEVGLRNADGATMIKTNAGWVTKDAYLAALAAAEQSQQSPPAQAQAPGADKVSVWEAQQMFAYYQDRIWSAILRPPCAASYNGCR